MHKKITGVICVLIGHSRIVNSCFGYVYCGRCKIQIADELAGAGLANAIDTVRVGHNCETCRANYAKMNWRDKFMVSYPFA